MRTISTVSPCLEHHRVVYASLDDRSVVLDRDRARVDAELIEIRQQLNRVLQLNFFSVDLQGDHSNNLMAA